MRDRKNRGEVERAMKTHLKVDKARTKVGRISRFGLLEMSRQRIRPSIEFSSYQQCEHCRGKGQVPSTETLGVAFLRKLSLESLKCDTKTIQGRVPPSVADYLLNRKRKELTDLEEKRSLAIRIEADEQMVPGDSQIICA
jgi:ribonuclease E